MDSFGRYLIRSGEFILKEGISFFTGLPRYLTIFGFGAAAVIWVFLVWIRVRRKEKNKAAAGVLLAILVLYLVFVFIITTLSRVPGSSRRLNMVLFHTYKEALAGGRLELEMILYNLILLSPLGFLLPLILEYRCGWRDILFLSFLVSASIEAVQYLFGLGLTEADDLFHNCLGALFGYGVSLLLKIALQCFGKGRRETE